MAAVVLLPWTFFILFSLPFSFSPPYPQAPSSLSPPLPLPLSPYPSSRVPPLFSLSLTLLLLLVSRLINIPSIQLHSIITVTKEHSSITIQTSADFAHPERYSLSQQQPTSLPACHQGSSSPATNCRILNDQQRLLSNLHHLLPQTDLVFHTY